MPDVRYVGPHPAVFVPGEGLEAERGKPVKVSAALARSLTMQDTWETVQSVEQEKSEKDSKAAQAARAKAALAATGGSK